MKTLMIIGQWEILGRGITIYGTIEKPLFLAKEIATLIEYDLSSINKMLNAANVNEKVRNIVPTLGGQQECWFLTEDGLYEVLMQSRKPIKKDSEPQNFNEINLDILDIQNYNMDIQYVWR